MYGSDNLHESSKELTDPLLRPSRSLTVSGEGLFF
jgi:hypothetical protein